MWSTPESSCTLRGVAIVEERPDSCTLDGPWPIRELLFITAKDGWAAGGNYYTGVGGIYFTSDGGNTWSVDVTTNAEMGSCDQKLLKTGHQVWCIGYDQSITSYVYSTVTSQ